MDRRCKHGMVPEWCAYCQQSPWTGKYNTGCRGQGFIRQDNREAIWQSTNQYRAAAPHADSRTRQRD